MKWVRAKREKLFHCNEKDEIDKLLEESFLTQTSTIEAKKKFISCVATFLENYQKDEQLSDKLHIFNVKKVCINSPTPPDDTDEKMQSIVSILCERKKNIIEKNRNIIAWTGIGVSLLLGVIGTFLSIDCSNTKLNDEQFKEIKESIEKSKPTDIRISDDAINTIRKQETKK